MNRRNFLKISGLGVGVASLFGWNLFKKRTELEDLYAYLESHTILDPMRGEVPFKLYPYQKQILKHIHENDRVLIVKARQIGMTTLLAGYIRWLDSPLYVYHGPNDSLERCFDKEYYNNFRQPNERRSHKFYCVFDECNFKTVPLPYVPIKSVEKLIIAGTPDTKGHLKWVVDRKDEIGLKVFRYSVYDCHPMWDKKSIKHEKEVYNICCSENTFERELEAKFV
jgi:hypothetical protein